jgi:hypothetical protein
MQVLDQQVAATRQFAEQRPNLVESLNIDLATLGGAARAIAAAAGRPVAGRHARLFDHVH